MIVPGGSLFFVIGPVVVDVFKAGQLPIRSFENDAKGCTQYRPTSGLDLRFDHNVSAPNVTHLHLNVAHLITGGLQGPG